MPSLLDRSLLLVAGKGGVGRSTVAAALAVACARRGRRTLLYQASASERFGELLGGGPVGSELTQLRPNLYAVNTSAEAALEEYGLMILRFKRVYRMVFENRVTKYFLRAIPGLDDYAVLGKAWYHVEERSGGRRRFDTVIFDLPASGHSLSMLKIPWVITDTVPEGPLTRDARSIKSMLVDPKRTAMVLVTLAEEMPTREAEELSAHFQADLGLAVGHIVVNQIYPDRLPADHPSSKVAEALASADGAGNDLAAVAAHAELLMSRRRLNEQYLAELEEQISAPRTELPMLFTRALGTSEVEHLSELVERSVTTP